MPFLLRVVVAFLAVTASALGQVVAYHNAAASYHLAQFNSLTGQGYRLTQLSVAGGLAAPRYSAIWEQVGGPAWVTNHGLTQAQYIAQRSTWLSQGYRPKLLTAAGSGADVVFAAVFVADGLGFADYLGMNETTFGSTTAAQRGLGRMLVSADIYGTSTTPLYCGVYENNVNDVVWGHVVDADVAGFTATFDAFYEGQARLSALGMSESQRYVSVWQDDRVGVWAARADATSSGWQTEFNTLTGLGLQPLVIASGGSGAALRFAGAFAQERTPRARVWTATGIARPEFAAFDAYMTNHVQATGARHAAIAICKSGRLVYTRGYTWAEAGSPITQPTSLMRVASLSKVPTAMAVHKLVANGVLSLSNKPATLLGLSGVNANFANVTLLQCLEYTSGLQRNFSPFGASELANPSAPVLPVTQAQATHWLSVQPTLFGPGAAGNYCNNSFMLAGHVITDVTGQALQTWMQANIYGPLGITRARVAAGLPQNLALGELRGYTRELELYPSQVYTDQRRKMPQWSGNPNLSAATGGMAFTPVDYARLLTGVFGLGQDWITIPPLQQSSMLARHTVTPLPGPDGLDQVTPGAFSWSARPNGVYAYHKGGTLEDAKTSAIWRTDGVAIVALVNKGESGTSADTLNSLAEAVAAWPDDDLFPTYGLASFPQRPKLDAIDVQTLPNVTNTPFVLTGERFDTVTAVNLGPHVILNTTPANWHLGWFRVISPTQMEVYPPQGIAPLSFTGISVSNAVGASSGLFVAISGTTGAVAVSAPPVVTPTQSFRVYCGSGSLPALSFAVLTLSTSNLPSSAPGIVDLGLGNQFSDLLVADFQLFDPVSRSAFWQLPPLPWPAVYVQTAAIDFGSVAPLPMPTSVVRQVVRQ
ncbi:MAG: serine hydrolase [Planctomycetes bacterium]|nr:serine hydrolase [Planctomycetota bacterium]